MGIIEKIKELIRETVHPSFDSLLHEFAIVEDRTMTEEERLEYVKTIQEELMWEEACEKAREEKKRKRMEAKAARIAKRAAKRTR